ncbi:MAG: S-adenosyl-l-methionine hydroxide adenosyltransferase family protein [Betaproteobacteria bacterium]|jgi:S-adenosylmethionine hydrolase|nr:SAM-dependent chlorinase/fluorinase [Rhodocyclaceae bacterium]MCA3134671.1 SAM-dependent chlorinase/fluorinase [Rhodocyclaceae bacterium]MCA3143136.1 SAM-dependent chlorinase/fluorinase [Rhodocyclaceae bacterium]MCA3144505.1 SAM-dependent chlorinase/fluorinase [Rhodocyclaceae bacterium]MCE2898110.1 SAM-dependent chlorinase/fluorinase [Betaproteobacteria bacterium]
MALMLFSDFGASDLYVGQVEAVLDRYAPGVRIVHLLHEAPCFDVCSSAHLLAALAQRQHRGHVFLTMVDPGVGTARGGIVARVDGRTYIGPDNGLLSVIWARGTLKVAWRIAKWPDDASPSFHGRDVFAPVAAAVATGEFPNETVRQVDAPEVLLPGEDLPRIIYVDHYGNTFTGLRGSALSTERRLRIRRMEFGHARVFAEAPPGKGFWYVNSVGLVEVAMPGGSAAKMLGLRVGQEVELL